MMFKKLNLFTKTTPTFNLHLPLFDFQLQQMDCSHLHRRLDVLQPRLPDSATIQFEPEFLGNHFLEKHSSIDC